MSLIDHLQDAVQRRGYSTTRTYRTSEGFLEIRDERAFVRVVILDEEARSVRVIRLTTNEVVLGEAEFSNLPASVVAVAALEILNFG